MTGAVAVTIVTFALLYQPSFPGPWEGASSDLLRHACAFGLLTLLILPATTRSLLALGGILTFAAALEAAQWMVPTRTVSLADLGASALGIALAWCLIGSTRAFVARLRPSPQSGAERQASGA